MFQTEQFFATLLCSLKKRDGLILSDPMPDLSKRKLIQQGLREEPINDEALRVFLKRTLVSSQSMKCLQCGSASELKKVRAFVWGSDETWEIFLPICQSCASQERSAAARCENQFAEDGGSDGKGVTSPMNREKWEDLYWLAALEVDGEKMPERIAAAREAVRGRLLDLAQDSDHHAEREGMRRALRNLDVIQAESKEW